jgi:hypothetical protein
LPDALIIVISLSSFKLATDMPKIKGKGNYLRIDQVCVLSVNIQ